MTQFEDQTIYVVTDNLKEGGLHRPTVPATIRQVHVPTVHFFPDAASLIIMRLYKRRATRNYDRKVVVATAPYTLTAVIQR